MHLADNKAINYCHLIVTTKTRAKKRRKFRISWLNLCYYKPSANSRQSRSYAGWRPINRQKNTRKNASTLPRLFRLFARLVASRDYSHSIVAIGFGLISKQTRHTPSTSLKIRSVIFFRTAQSISGTVHTIASTVFTARMITGQ